MKVKTNLFKKALNYLIFIRIFHISFHAFAIINEDVFLIDLLVTIANTEWRETESTFCKRGSSI